MVKPSGFRREEVSMSPLAGFRFCTAASLLFALTLVSVPAIGQHAHPVSPPHASAPPPRMAAPPRVAQPPGMVAPPHVQNSVGSYRDFRLTPPRVVAPTASSTGISPAVVASRGSSAAILGHTTIGFPEVSARSGESTWQHNPAAGGTLFGDGHNFWRDGSANRIVGEQAPATAIRRRIWPVRGRPIFYPVFYPTFYPEFWGLGWGAGFGTCDPFWGWNAGCGFPYGDYLLGGYGEGYFGPSEPSYEPVPSDKNTNGEQDELVLYLTDGTVYLISNYWLTNDQIHYRTSGGEEHAIDLQQVDLQKTVDVNAKRGVEFTLRPGPAAKAPNEQGGAPTQ